MDAVITQSEIPDQSNSAASPEMVTETTAPNTPPVSPTNLQKRCNSLKELALRLSRNEYSASLDEGGPYVFQNKGATPLHAVDLGNGLAKIDVFATIKWCNGEEENFSFGILHGIKQAIYLRNTLDNFIWAELNRTLDEKD